MLANTGYTSTWSTKMKCGVRDTLQFDCHRYQHKLYYTWADVSADLSVQVLTLTRISCGRFQILRNQWAYCKRIQIAPELIPASNNHDLWHYILVMNHNGYCINQSFTINPTQWYLCIKDSLHEADLFVLGKEVVLFRGLKCSGTLDKELLLDIKLCPL